MNLPTSTTDYSHLLNDPEEPILPLPTLPVPISRKIKQFAFFRRKLDRLVAGDITPLDAALDFDACITAAANQRHEALAARLKDARTRPLAHRPDPTPARISKPLEIGPDPIASAVLLLDFVATYCSSVPPWCPAQERLVAFVAALKALPVHGVLDGPPPEDPAKPHHRVWLWAFECTWLGEIAVEGFESVGRENCHCGPDFAIPGSEKQLRWRYLQSAVARITAAGLLDCRSVCALEYLVPTSPRYPDIRNEEIDWAHAISGDVLASAEWILRPGMGRYVFEQCLRRETVDNPTQMWSQERWVGWKEQFRSVVQHPRVTAQARDVSWAILQQMLAVEEEYVRQLCVLSLYPSPYPCFPPSSYVPLG
ncbi:hypothetical protein BO70DRAFT_362013 [Aspergillus heteromorphus CBS 117.55]|uniref:Uncharacterized protein n=1 Tax=Aspergillus heteromorphus CBS 117.55 TaxID=1448321 RepID=A0A317W9R5_9EURO|nr:uncharacterized protein BO70DRAFT_362013 [Aspergillus heteromorphus CBS 117.55]PWY82022.1 hypothetical protein BO70DRAFT_362013 [Aspergillus heteromorphus CBS 117.55]